MVDIVARLIEQDVADPASKHDTERRPHQEVVDILPRNQMRRSSGQSQAITPADQQPDDVGKRIPADGKRSDRNCNRVDRRKRDRKKWHEQACGTIRGTGVSSASYKGPKADRQGTRPIGSRDRAVTRSYRSAG